MRTVGTELGARFVMEGSLRQAGAELRARGAARRCGYRRASLGGDLRRGPSSPEQVFAMQDDLVPRIVSTCADHFGVLARTMSEAVRGKPVDQLSPYEALMRGFGYHYRLSAEEHAEARDVWRRPSSRRRRTPTAGRCCRGSTRTSTRTASTLDPGPSTAPLQPRSAPWTSPRRIPSHSRPSPSCSVLPEGDRRLPERRRTRDRVQPARRKQRGHLPHHLRRGMGPRLTLLRWAMDVNPNHPRWYRADPRHQRVPPRPLSRSGGRGREGRTCPSTSGRA